MDTFSAPPKGNDLGQALFQMRDYTPVPLVIIFLFFAKPTLLTATLGTLVAIFGELLRIYAVSYIGSISRTRKSSTGDALIVNGPFAWTRNPLYIANFIIVLGISIYTGKLWLCVLATLAFFFQYHFIVSYEEGILEEKFKEVYQTYKHSVPRWFPARIPDLQDWEWPDSYAMALKSEKRTLTAIIAMLVLLSFCG